MFALIVIGAVLLYALFVACGGPWWQRRVFRSLRAKDSLEARFAAQVLPALLPSASDHQRAVQLDGALEIMALELEILRSIAEDLTAVWQQARFACALSTGGWSDQALDRIAALRRVLRSPEGTPYR